MVEAQTRGPTAYLDSPETLPADKSQRSAWLSWTIAFGLAGLVFGIWWGVSPHRTGDPRGRINAALQSAAVRILPSDAYDIQEMSYEPGWIGSCGEVFKLGWSVVTHDVVFRSHLAPGQVRATLRHRLQQAGWTYHGVSAYGTPSYWRGFVDHEPVTWTHPLGKGVNAGMDDFPPDEHGYPGAWLLQLTAPPVAPVGECVGG
jgi:hypothetical protein